MKAKATPLAFHGVTLRSNDPDLLTKKLRALLGWKVLRRGAREVVLGAGPELFVEIRRARRGEPEGVYELHLAVEGIRQFRQASRADELGGDSWTRPLMALLALTVREFRRAPAAKWRKPRPKT